MTQGDADASGLGQRSETAQRMDDLTFELALVYFRLTRVARELLGEGKHSSGRRSVLRSLGIRGPHSITAMAVERSVSRQHTHKLVDGLRKDGLVSLQSDPKDRRSKLVSLTDEGRAFLVAMVRKETALLEALGGGIPRGDVAATMRVMRLLRERLDRELESPSA